MLKVKQSKICLKIFKGWSPFPHLKNFRFFKQSRYFERAGADAPIYLTTVFKHHAAEVLKLISNFAQENKKTRFVPRHIQLPLRIDEQLNKFMPNTLLLAVVFSLTSATSSFFFPRTIKSEAVKA